MMKKRLAQFGMVTLVAMSLVGCSNMSTKQKNTAMGAAVGGVAGNLMTNSTAGTLGGAALGGVIGNVID